MKKLSSLHYNCTRFKKANQTIETYFMKPIIIHGFAEAITVGSVMIYRDSNTGNELFKAIWRNLPYKNVVTYLVIYIKYMWLYNMRFQFFTQKNM